MVQVLVAGYPGEDPAFGEGLAFAAPACEVGDREDAGVHFVHCAGCK